MKRCPVDQGGCGQLVDMLFDSGLCQKCDAEAKRGTAAAGGPVRRAGRRKLVAANGAISEDPPRETNPTACDKYVKGPERGICATCGATRAAHLSKPRQKRSPKASPNGAFPTDSLMVIERLRSQYSDEHAAAMKRAVEMEARLEVLDDVEKELKAGAK